MKSRLISGVKELRALCDECIEELQTSVNSNRVCDILGDEIPDKSDALFDVICELDKSKDAHTHQGREEIGCASDKDKKHQKAGSSNTPQKLSLSPFEKFCVKRGIDPLTAGKPSLVRAGELYLAQVNQFRSLLGGRKISQTQGREAVRDYISRRQARLDNC